MPEIFPQCGFDIDIVIMASEIEAAMFYTLQEQLLLRALTVISMQMADDALAETALQPLHQRARLPHPATAWWNPTSVRIARNASFVPE